MVSHTHTRSKHHYLEIAKSLQFWDLSARQLSDLEMLLTSAFQPLQGFMNQGDYNAVLDHLRLESGELCPVPITLDVSKTFAESLEIGQQIALRDTESVVISLMTIESIWRPDKDKEAQCIYETLDTTHPGVDYLLHRTGEYYLGGKLINVELPTHHDYQQYRHTPSELRKYFKARKWKKIIAYHSDTVMHRREKGLTDKLAQKHQAELLIQTSVGYTQNQPIEHFSRIRCYEYLLDEYTDRTPKLNLMNFSSRMAGPREALWHAIIHKNHGCTHFILEKNHAHPKLTNTNNQTFYSETAAIELAQQYEDEIGIHIVVDEDILNAKEQATASFKKDQQNTNNQTLTSDNFFQQVQTNPCISESFTYPAILKEIRKSCPPRHQQGLTVFFTGLSGSGKSTVANTIKIKLLELGGRPVTLLDGDVVRQNLSSELTFSKEHRDLNIRRIGFVASEITKNGGIAICAPIAPYASMRREVREMIESVGGFIEVHISTPLEECERRDRKGLYAKARAGIIKHFTGINDPYEIPENPESRLDTTEKTPEACAQTILEKLEELGFIKS